MSAKAGVNKDQGTSIWIKDYNDFFTLMPALSVLCSMGPNAIFFLGEFNPIHHVNAKNDMRYLVLYIS